MKKLSERTARRYSFYFMKYGLFVIISMFAYIRLYSLMIFDVYGRDRAAYLFYVLPNARAMVEHTLITLCVIIGASAMLDIVTNNKNSL